MERKVLPKRVAEWFEKNGHIADAVSEMEATKGNEEALDENGEYYQIYTCDIASGSWGWRQFLPVLDFFGFEYETSKDERQIISGKSGPFDYVYVWEDIESFADEVCEELEKLAPGKFFFGNNEFDSAYGLFYVVPVEEGEVTA